jgi:hypothetical protein
MTHAEFRAMALALYGHHWQAHLARALGVNDRTVRRWAREDYQLPPWLEEKMTELAGGREGVSVPRDEWMIAEGAERRRYIVHALPPRFFCRAVQVDDDGDTAPGEAEADLLRGVTYSSDDIVLCEFHWIDAAPSGHRLTQLIEAACDALDEFDASDAGAGGGQG